MRWNWNGTGGRAALSVGAIRELRAEKDEQIGRIDQDLKTFEAERDQSKDENAQLKQRLEELESLVTKLADQVNQTSD